jgi:hypothetical protein
MERLCLSGNIIRLFDPAGENVEEKLLDGNQVLIEMRHLGIPASAGDLIVLSVRMHIGRSGRRQHCLALSKSTHPSYSCLLRFQKFFPDSLLLHIQALKADVMTFVRDLILKLLGIQRGVKIKKNRTLIRSCPHKTVLGGLYYGVNLSPDPRSSGQVRQDAFGGCFKIRPLPRMQSGSEIGRPGDRIGGCQIRPERLVEAGVVERCFPRL